jgi:hypothetical protein
VQAWVGSRLLLLLAGLGVMWFTGRSAGELVANWDVLHFFGIARDGYATAQEVAFFPGLPLLLRAGAAAGVPMAVGGVVLSLVGSGFAAWGLYRLGGPRAGVFAAVAWLVAPTAVFTVVPYTESLFCAFAFWAWVRARDDRWAWAAALAACASAFRVSGLFLVAALAVLAITRPAGLRGERERRARLARLPWLALPVAVLAAYVVYLRVTQGSWTAWYAAQAAGWQRTLTWPWDSIRHTIPAIVPGAYADHPGWASCSAEVVSVVVGRGDGRAPGPSALGRRPARRCWRSHVVLADVGEPGRPAFVPALAPARQGHRRPDGAVALPPNRAGSAISPFGSLDGVVGPDVLPGG